MIDINEVIQCWTAIYEQADGENDMRIHDKVFDTKSAAEAEIKTLIQADKKTYADFYPDFFDIDTDDGILSNNTYYLDIRSRGDVLLTVYHKLQTLTI